LVTQTKVVRFRQPLNDTPQGNELLSSVKETPGSARREHEKWLRLYSEPDVWENPEKRHAMYQARWEYQNAILAYLGAIRKKTN
jgi:hypothetical protein